MSRLPPLLVALLLVAPAAADGPFTDLGYEAATAKAKEAGKLLMLDFTASWCPPCKMLEKQTWPDQKVIDWMAAHAIAIQVDVDVVGNAELAQKFGVRSIPTMVFLRDGAELDRYTGFKSPADFIAWGDDVASGKVTPDSRAAEAAASATSDDPDRRRDLAKELARQGKLDESTEHYLWVWKATRDAPGWLGVRHSFLLSEMVRLGERHEPMREALQEQLEAAQRNIETVETITWLDWIEWTSLCERLDAAARIVAWYDAHHAADGSVDTSRLELQVVPRVRRDAFDQLVAARRFAEAARAGGDLVADVRGWTEMHAKLREGAGESASEEDRQLLAAYADSVVENCAPKYGCAFAAGQIEAAHEIAKLVLGVVDTPQARVALVQAALDMSDTADAQLSTLLDEAASAGVDEGTLRSRLQERTAAAAVPSGR